MAECSACGARYSPGEHFCGNCGTQLTPSSSEMKTIAATFGDTVDEQPMTSAQFANTLEDDPETRENPLTDEDEPAPVAEVDEVVEEPAAAKSDFFHGAETGEPKPVSSASLGGSYTDNIHEGT